MNLPCGSPFSFQLSGPENRLHRVGVQPPASFGLIERPDAATAACGTWAAANASAASSAGEAPW
jgi:hypothetical protein